MVIPVKDENPQVVIKLLYELEQYGYPSVVVDDGSKIPVPGADIRFERSQGYGAALKAGIARASTDLICTMDGDGQHTVYDVKRLEDFMVYFPENAMIIGDRRLYETGARYWGRKALNWVATLWTWRWIPDLNSGLRIFRRSAVLGYFPLLCNGFSFTTSLTFCLLTDNCAVDWLPIKVWIRKSGQSHVRVWRDGWITLRTMCWLGLGLKTRRLRAWLHG